MKLRYTSLLIIAIIFICTSCSIDEENEKMMLLSSDIAKVMVSKSEGFGGLNENSFVVFDDLSSTATFEEAMKAAEKQPGIMDMVEPEYDLLVEYGEGEDPPTHGLHLWLGEEGGHSTLMYIGHDTAYRVPVGLSEKLRKLILSKVQEQ